MNVADLLHDATYVQLRRGMPELCPEGVNASYNDLIMEWTDTLEINAGRDSKVPLALESVLMSVLHAPVMQSLATMHAHADAAIHEQAQRHCKAGSKVVPCHETRCDCACYGAHYSILVKKGHCNIMPGKAAQCGELTQAPINSL